MEDITEEDLKSMNRAHDANEALSCLEKATQYFDNITIDLIYGIPNMSLEKWHKNLEIVFSFGINHISSYALTVEPKTALDAFIKNGSYPPMDENLALLHFNHLVEETKNQGFVHYETSNFGKPDYFSKHNSSYWQGKSYIGIGIDNPAATAYFSVSPLGFKSMVLSPDKSAVFIEPISSDLGTYTVYKKSDKKQSLTKFECSVIDQVAPQMDGATARPNADDALMRTFRLAMSCTGEYTAYFGGTKALALAAINASITRCNGVFEKDFGARMIIIANTDLVIYTSASTDPYSAATSLSQWNSQLQSTLTSVIGEANYDIGHLFGASGGGGNAGCIGCICVDDTASTTDLNKGLNAFLSNEEPDFSLEEANQTVTAYLQKLAETISAPQRLFLEENSKNENKISGDWTFGGDFHESMARISRNGKTGFINKKGDFIIASTKNKAQIINLGRWGVVCDKGKGILIFRSTKWGNI
mgnify:CR=1 FL=1